MAVSPTALVSAGEPSGDAHAGSVLMALKRLQPAWQFEGCGGPCLRAAGLDLVASVDQLSAIGFLEAAGSLPRHLRLLRRLTVRGGIPGYRLALLVDYPGFHLKLGERLRAVGVPVLQYVAPQFWAWHPGRIRSLRRAVDRVAAILPFEEAWFQARGVDCRFVGHPIVDRATPDQGRAREELGLPAGAPVLGIFPGSRLGEIVRHWPVFRAVGQSMLGSGRCAEVLVAGTAEGHYPGAAGFRLVINRPEIVMAAATAALVKSGTVSLEAAWAGVPHVVVYRASWSTQAIAQLLMTVDRISLVNLIAADLVVPEFWRRPLSEARIAGALGPLLDRDSREASTQRAAFAKVRGSLGPPGVAERVARLALGLVKATV